MADKTCRCGNVFSYDEKLRGNSRRTLCDDCRNLPQKEKLCVVCGENVPPTPGKRRRVPRHEECAENSKVVNRVCGCGEQLEKGKRTCDECDYTDQLAERAKRKEAEEKRRIAEARVAELMFQLELRGNALHQQVKD